MRITYFAVLGAVLAGAAFAQTDWPTFGNDLAGTRYSPLKQIDTKNVSKLVRAWTYHMNPGGDAPAAAPARRLPRAAGEAGAAGAEAEDATGRSRRWSSTASCT